MSRSVITPIALRVSRLSTTGTTPTFSRSMMRATSMTPSSGVTNSGLDVMISEIFMPRFERKLRATRRSVGEQAARLALGGVILRARVGERVGVRGEHLLEERAVELAVAHAHGVALRVLEARRQVVGRGRERGLEALERVEQA